jgi:hypothetical protein
MLYRKYDGNNTKQFHEERILTTHIRYLDVFRLYVINESHLDTREKERVNIMLVDEIERFVNLLRNSLNNISNNITQLQDNIKIIRNNPTNFKLKINT